MYENQFQYDNAEEADRSDNTQSYVMEEMEDAFNENFVLTLYEEGDEFISDLLLKVASGTSELDVAKLVSALQSFYQLQLEKYTDDNYTSVYNQLRDYN
jgi:hypothetical protein